MKSNQLVVLVILLFFVSCIKDNEEKQRSIHKETFKKQTKNFNYDFDREIIANLEVIYQGESPIKSFWLKWYDNYLWAGDNTKLIRYDSTLSSFKSYGRKGGGPEENLNIAYFSATKSNYIIFDLDKQRIATYSLNDSLLHYQRFNNGTTPFVDYFGLQRSNNEYLLIYEETGKSAEYDYKLTIKDTLGNTIKDYSLKNLLKINDIKDLELALEGEFITNHPNLIVFYFFKVGKFIVYDSKSKEIKIYDTIDKTPIPKTVKIAQGNGGFAIKTEPEYIIFSCGAVSERYLYLLSSLNKKKSKTIDIYQLDNGQYIGSIKLPNLQDTQRPELIEVSPDGKDLYVQYENLTLVKYSIDYFSK
jgi:hypothetical protein